MNQLNREKKSREKLFFISIASVIPIAIFLNRFLIPDTSFDSLYYHIFNGYRASSNAVYPYSSHEFYPSGFGTLMPIYDVLFYISRFLLGYRLGTVLSLLSYIGVIYIAYRLLDFIFYKKQNLNIVVKGFFFINCFVVTELLFQLATYYVDILDVLIILIGLFIFIKYLQTNKSPYLWFSSLIFGLAFLAKATNIIYLVPYVMMVSYNILFQIRLSTKNKLMILIGLGLVIIVPTVLYDLRNLVLTSNPVFPLYNGIFKSSYYAPISFSPNGYGFGGADLFQKLLWPIVSFWHAARLSSPHNIFNDWKLGVEWLISFVLLLPVIWKKLTTEQRYLVVFFYVSMMVWSLSVGIMRYIAVDDVLGGILLLLVFLKFYSVASNNKIIGIVLVFASLVVLVVANYRVINFNLKYDMSWRPTFLYNRAVYAHQTSHLFDRSLQSNTENEQSQIGLNCIPQSDGLLALTDYNKPVLNIIDQEPNLQMVEQRAFRVLASNKIEKIYNNSKASFITYIITDRAQSNFQTCLENIHIAGGKINKIFLLNSYFGYSPYEKPLVITGEFDLKKFINSNYNIKPGLQVDYTPQSFLYQQSFLLNEILQKY